MDGCLPADELYVLIFTPQSTSFFFKLIFCYFWLCWAFIAAGRLSLAVASGGYFLAMVASLIAEHGVML